MDFPQNVHQHRFLEQSARYLGLPPDVHRELFGSEHEESSSTTGFTLTDCSREDGA